MIFLNFNHIPIYNHTLLQTQLHLQPLWKVSTTPFDPNCETTAYYLHNANALFQFIIEYIINQGIAVSHSKYHSLSIIIITRLNYHSTSGRQTNHREYNHSQSVHVYIFLSHAMHDVTLNRHACIYIYMIPHLFVCTVSKPMLYI